MMRSYRVGILHTDCAESGEAVISFNNFDSSAKKSGAKAPGGALAPHV
jgi:hypothetical protein